MILFDQKTKKVIKFSYLKYQLLYRFLSSGEPIIGTKETSLNSLMHRWVCTFLLRAIRFSFRRQTISSEAIATSYRADKQLPVGQLAMQTQLY